MHILSLLLVYKYPLLFVLLFFGGDTIFLAGIYLSLIGEMNLVYVTILAYAAAILSDIVWYYVGSLLSYQKIRTLPFVRNKVELVDKLQAFFDRKAFSILFYSKFVYGTRTVVQTLCGTHRLNFWKYLWVNLVGTAILVGALVSLGIFLDTSFAHLRHIVHRIEILFLVLVLLIYLIHSILGRRMLKEMIGEEENK